MELLMAH
jgi:hypothetical protein